MTGELGGAFLRVVFPVILIVGFGYLLGRARPMELAPLTALSVSVLVPGIVFDSLARAALPRPVLGRLVLHVLLLLAGLGLVTLAAAALLGWRGASRDALLLAACFPNSGNVGIALALFAFGAAGLAVAAGWFAISAIATHTIGVLIASRSGPGPGQALAQLARLPITYAIAAGLVVNLAGVSLPEPVARASQLLANGAVAVLLLLVGLQLARLTLRHEAFGATVATAIRLPVAPPLAWVLGRAVGLEGMALGVAVLQSGTPTAITAALWAMEYDTRPGLVAATVVLSTLASVVTLTLLLTVLAARP